MRIISGRLVFLLLLLWIFPDSSWAGVARGIFGIPSVKTLHPSQSITKLKGAGITDVFVPPDGETIRWYKRNGFKVYIAINAFGGKSAWNRYKGSRPLKGDGRFLGSEPDYKGFGGVCPTHPKWRAERLKRIKSLVKEFGGKEGIDGIWLDFIRYPGLWEVKDPQIPDNCYCQRCLRKFQADSHVKLPATLKGREAALWIKEHCPYEWMKWKKEKILSFVVNVKKILGNLKLGLFLVPWTKGEKGNAISYQLAQDAFQLSRVADAISPMLYHKICGKPPSWVGHMTRYYREESLCKLLPIVQAIDCSAQEFARAVDCAARGGADGVLVFSLKGMREDLWSGIRQFQPLRNLIPNPEFEISKQSENPRGWNTRKPQSGSPEKSTFSVKLSDGLRLRKGAPRPERPSRCIGITGSHDGAGEWYCPLPQCEPGDEYVFSGRFYRQRWQNGVYPTIRVWGQEFYLNNHWLSRSFQPIRAYVTCPEGPSEHTFRFLNNNPGETFWLTRPHLTKYYAFSHMEGSQQKHPSFYEHFFPIGVYGATLENLEQIKNLGINTVLLGGHSEVLKKTVMKCQRLGLKYVLAVPREPDRLPPYLETIGHYVQRNNLAFYVNDEPGIHSFPTNKANDINRLIKESFPGAPTCMAVVRPQVCRDYRQSSDFFMMDQYPVPFMPMTWISDSMDRASVDVGQGRLASVIQAFGGKRWADVGWPRMPNWQEMDCLAFLSICHGSRGVLFFTFQEIGKTKEGRKRLGRVVGRLNRLYPWLIEKNLPQKVNVEMVSTYRVGPKGRPAIHCCLKKKGDEFLLIAVNTIGTYVEAMIQCGDLGGEPGEITENPFHRARKFKEVFSGVCYPGGKEGLRVKFKPYETKVFVSEKGAK